MCLGLFCIYLSQVRSSLIMMGICCIVFLAVLLRRGELGRFGAVLVVAAGVSVGVFFWAASVGGNAVTGRLSTLVKDNPGSVYYRNRGKYLEQTINEHLPKYPLGAGLGRWGMMNQYFGDNSDPQRAMVWAEVQWTGWLLDGGLPLIVVYTILLALTGLCVWKICLTRLPGDLASQAALVLAYDVGAYAVTFNYTLFIGQGGLEFWLLNALLLQTAYVQLRANYGRLFSR